MDRCEWCRLTTAFTFLFHALFLFPVFSRPHIFLVFSRWCSDQKAIAKKREKLSMASLCGWFDDDGVLFSTCKFVWWNANISFSLLLWTNENNNWLNTIRMLITQQAITTRTLSLDFTQLNDSSRAVWHKNYRHLCCVYAITHTHLAVAIYMCVYFYVWRTNDTDNL